MRVSRCNPSAILVHSRTCAILVHSRTCPLHRCLCCGVSPRWRPYNPMIISHSIRGVLTCGDTSSRWVDRTASTSMTSDHLNFLEQSEDDTSSQLHAPHPIKTLHVQLPILCPPTIRPVTVDAPKGTVLAQCFNPPEPTAICACTRVRTLLATALKHSPWF
jgi:hypothetical protein